MTIAEKAEWIVRDLKQETSASPAALFDAIINRGYVSIHGPEHHILDGACLLTAYKNAGGQIDLDTALNKIMQEGLRMPGAMCGLWGVCGAVTSIGAALAIIDGTGPLSTDGMWGEHMSFTAQATDELGRINGPRCCKRDAMTALHHAVEYLAEHKGIRLPWTKPACHYSRQNAQCIHERCPYYAG